MAFLTRPVFAKPAPARRPGARPRQAAAAAFPVEVVRKEKPAPVMTAMPAVALVEQPAMVSSAPKVQAHEEKPMRTLAEVRADLARLREKSRERQAQQQRAMTRHDVAFPATDFMEFVPSVPERRSEKDEAGESFAPTAFVDFTVLKTR